MCTSHGSRGVEDGPRSGVSWGMVGGGGHGRSVADVLRRLGDSLSRVVAISSPDWLEDDVEFFEDDDLLGFADGGLQWVVAIGDCSRRLGIVKSLLSQGKLVSPVVAITATVAPDVVLGAGTVVMEHAHIGSGTTIGIGVLVNTSAIVEHDVVIGEGTHIAPGSTVLGTAVVGSRTLIGSGGRVLSGVHVADDCLVGAGAVVISDLPERSRVMGIPARER